MAKATVWFICVYLALFTSFCMRESSACGITTHIIISHIAKQYFNLTSNGIDFKKLIYDHGDAFLAGSPYPDAFYDSTCNGGRFHDISEDTHWSGFTNATINYIRKNYPTPWDEGTQKLVVFLFGILSHQVADVVWHSLGIEQGFLSTMANVNFHGVFDKAHSVGDFGGDIVNSWSRDMKALVDPNKEWYVPVDDLYNIYKEYYGSDRISADIIDNCTTFLLLAGFAEKIVGSEAYPLTARMSPFLVDQLNDYFLGGMDDMANWSDQLWKQSVTMLENGTEACDLNHNPVFINCSKPGNVNVMSGQRSHKPLYRKLKFGSLQRSDLVIEKKYRGIVIKPAGNLKKLLEKENAKRQLSLKWNTLSKSLSNQITASELKRTDPAQSGIYFVKRPYPEFGWSLSVADLDGDGNEDVVVGSPGYGDYNSFQQGRVFVIYNTDNGLPVSKGPYYLVQIDASNFTNILRGPTLQSGARFGCAVHVMDVNIDGVPDIVVGSSGHSNSGNLLQYNGAVYVYFGVKGQKFVQKKPDITITCQSQYCNLGFTLTSVDISGDGHRDLVMGTPYYQIPLNQSGIVSSLASDSSYTSGLTFAFEDLIKKWSLSNPQAFSWFGYSIHEKEGYLIVGQPNYRKCFSSDCSYSVNDTQTVGMVSLYNIENKHKLPGFTFKGQREFDMAGASTDIGYPYDNTSVILAIGIPGADIQGTVATLPFLYRQAGTVMLFNISSSDIQLVAQLYGDRPFGRFGAFVRFSDIDGDGLDDLMIGAPKRNSDVTDLLPRYLSSAYDGRIGIYYGGSNFPKGNASLSAINCKDNIPCPFDIANFTLSPYGYYVYMGYNAAVLKAKNLTNIMAPSFYGAEELDDYDSGSTIVYKLDKSSNKMVESNHKVEQNIYGNNAKERNKNDSEDLKNGVSSMDRKLLQRVLKGHIHKML